jgi:hypothetical protein
MLLNSEANTWEVVGGRRLENLPESKLFIKKLKRDIEIL